MDGYYVKVWVRDIETAEELKKQIPPDYKTVVIERECPD